MSKITKEYLIEKYGDQAYHKVTEAIAAMVIIGGDPDKAKEMADAAIELMQLGYHKKGTPPKWFEWEKKNDTITGR